MKDTQKQKLIRYWKDGARRSLALADDVFEKKYYDHALFCGHLALEKLLKARTIDAINSPAPHSHDLLYLAGIAKIDIDIEQQQFLAEVNTYNIEGRYPEEKLEFHRRITRPFARQELKKIHDFYIWLSKQKEKF